MAYSTVALLPSIVNVSTAILRQFDGIPSGPEQFAANLKGARTSRPEIGSGLVVVAAVEFFGVEWISNEPSALQQVGPLLGSLFVASVAAFAAWLAAHTANERQQEQLASAERQQREQLDHDLKVRKDEYSRDAIDAAVLLATRVQGQIASVSTSAKLTQRKRVNLSSVNEAEFQTYRSLRADLERHEAELNQEVIALRDLVLEMHPQTIRLSLRLGAAHFIPELNQKLMNKWWECTDLLLPVAQRNWRDDEAEAIEKTMQVAGDIQAHLHAACEAWFQEDR
jgi:hypothetical protein